MHGLGTIINVGCILLGGTCGLLFGRRIGARMQDTLMKITGVAVMFLGVAGAMEQMLRAGENGLLSTSGSMMMIVSLALGAIIGEALDLDSLIVRFGEFLKAKTHSEGDGSFVSGFVSASCTVCIGAMAVVGSVEDGISGDFSLLASKGVLDAIIICVMTASSGKGCIFSAIPVGVFQGLTTLAAVFAGSFMTAPELAALSMVGAVLIFCVGANLVFKTDIRVANVLPSIVIAAVWAGVF